MNYLFSFYYILLSLKKKYPILFYLKKYNFLLFKRRVYFINLLFIHSFFFCSLSQHLKRTPLLTRWIFATYKQANFNFHSFHKKKIECENLFLLFSLVIFALNYFYAIYMVGRVSERVSEEIFTRVWQNVLLYDGGQSEELTERREGKNLSFMWSPPRERNNTLSS